MINKIKHIATSLCILAAMISCSGEFLEIDPEQNVAAEKAVTDVNTLQTAVNGVYSKLQNSGYYGRNMYVIPELMADNLKLSIRNTGRYQEYDGFALNDQDLRADEIWNVGYETVVNATRAIQGGEKLLETFPEQKTEIDQLVGEAYALKAMAHFDLVRLFAQPYNFTDDASHLGIPVVKEVGEGEISPKRNTVKEVYLQINDDLTAAITKMNLPKNDGKFSINSAKALAARVALYQEDYDKAISQSTDVINSGEFSLIPNSNYSDVWSVDYNSESIFEIVNTVSDNAGTNSIGHFVDPSGYADALATEDLYDTYDTNDVRLNAIIPGSKTGAEDYALFVGKFPKGTEHDDNIRVLRLAEQYLIRAEAYAKTDREDLARADVQTIADRGNPDAPDVTETGVALIDRILLERRKELAFEGHRLFDLNRNKRDVNIIQSGNVIEASYPNDKFILPIPIDEINANPNVTQNVGY